MLKSLLSVCMIVKCTILKRGLYLVLLLILSGCVVNTGPFEPEVVYYPSAWVVDNLSSPFPPLTKEEMSTEWGKELFLGIQFAREFDLYRAITCYKRAAFIAPPCKIFEIQYHLLEAYYLGRKHQDAIEIYECGNLGQIRMDSPGINELMLMIYDSYRKTNQCAKAARILGVIESTNPDLEDSLEEYEAVETADFETLAELTDDDLTCFLNTYCTLSKSVKKAQFLNAVLPGTGYYYVGQKKTAVTAFIVNALFIYAAYQFFDRGYVAAGLITTSLEMGWYLGGINGAGLAAQELNEATYATLAKDYLIKKRLFPVLMFQYAF